MPLLYLRDSGSHLTPSDLYLRDGLLEAVEIRQASPNINHPPSSRDKPGIPKSPRPFPRPNFPPQPSTTSSNLPSSTTLPISSDTLADSSTPSTMSATSPPDTTGVSSSSGSSVPENTAPISTELSSSPLATSSTSAPSMSNPDPFESTSPTPFSSQNRTNVMSTPNDLTLTSSLTISSPFVVSTSSGAPSLSPQNALAKKPSDAGRIAGGVVGGFVLLALILALVLLFLRRRRKKHTAPSAEFMRQGSPSRHVPLLFGAHGDARDGQDNSTDDLPPTFTRGNFNDPLIEKLRQPRG